MHREPTEEVRERLLRAKGRTSEATREQISKLSAEYLEARNSKLRSQAFLAEAQAKEKAGELISRQLVVRQAQYIVICLRQAILNFPSRYARQIVGLESEHEVKEALDKAAREFLTELASFPSRITDPNWLSVVEAQEEGSHPDGAPLRPATGAEIKTEQEKARSGVRRRPRRCASCVPKAEKAKRRTTV